MKAHRYSFGLLLIAILAIGLVPGCNASPQAQLDRAEVVYGETLTALNTAYQSGAIDKDTQLKVISPARKTARESLDQAKAAYKLGDPGWKTLLDAATGALEGLQKYTGPTTKPVSTGPSIRPAPPMATASAAAIPIALALLQVISQLAPVAQKLINGEELTAEERALAEKHSADATAQADANDADAAKKA